MNPGCGRFLTAIHEDMLAAPYDLRNILDLLRYFFPTPPVPVRWRRRMIAFGSGDPTRAICSSLIAQAFQGIQYPILPKILVDGVKGGRRNRPARYKAYTDRAKADWNAWLT